MPEKNKMNSRSSGVLMHITSLPSKFGTGELGYHAYRFADFLSQSLQKFWQVLPLNPTNAQTGFSPYSSDSSFAGNILMISLHLLVEENLLEPFDIADTEKGDGQEADFNYAT